MRGLSQVYDATPQKAPLESLLRRDDGFPMVAWMEPLPLGLPTLIPPKIKYTTGWEECLGTQVGIP